VVAISYNEQENMRRFLEHLATWVDEIVVVDDGSSDGTAAIAREFPGQVTFVESPRAEGEYFSHQRNKGIELARSDWLLHMDIDERVSPALAREITERIREPGRKAWRFRRLNHFMNRPMSGGGWQTWNQVHLARREVLRFGGMFHESVELACTEDETGQLKSYMYHLNETDLRHRLRKSDTYLEEVIGEIVSRHPRVGPGHLVTLPALEFIKRYLVRRGFRDGVPGLISALHSATAKFRACALAWEQQHPVSRAALEDSFRREWQATDWPPASTGDESGRRAP
jgi:glycosyltransferase involved in cell wall biosynthesis